MATGLYPYALADEWVQVTEPVRQLHNCQYAQPKLGCVAIRRGQSWTARMMGRLMQLPLASRSARLELTITSDGSTERWCRRFDGIEVTTVQSLASRGQLQERLGMLVFWFVLTPDEGGLSYHHSRTFILLGKMGIPLPHWLTPTIAAQERPAGHQVRVAVTVTLPCAGLLLSYEGFVTANEGAQ